MNSFFEKLKKGMGIEGPAEVETEEKIEEKLKPVRIKKTKKESKPSIIQIKKLDATLPPPFKTELIKKEVEEVETPETMDSNPATTLQQKQAPEKTPLVKAAEDKEKWFETEGELAIDVYQTENELVIQSAIAGVKPENLDILIEQDIITIKGSREKPEDGGAYFARECYWGPFSRKVILPVEIDPNRIEATMKEGILTIRLPKILRERKRKIVVRG